MKKADRGQSKTYEKLELCRADAEAIVNVIAEHFERIRIEANGYDLDAISEIDRLDDSFITQFKVSGYSAGNYVLVELSDTSTYVHLTNANDLVAFGVYKRVEEILDSRVRWQNKYVVGAGWATTVLGMLTLQAAIFLYPDSMSRLQATGVGVLGIVMLFGGAAATFPGRQRRASRIRLSKPEPSFWAAKKHDIMLLAIGAVLGVVATVAADTLATVVGGKAP